ncbi:MAG: hypothetical protein J6R66_00765 [Clostridia bacterium]|nr:hypothetical protein [Clostridia bacterium]
MAKNFCIYCGSRLIPGVECACRAEVAPATYEVPAAPVSAPEIASAPSKFCIYCGKPLLPDEVCGCRTPAPEVPEVPETTVEPEAPAVAEEPAYSIPPETAVTGGIKSTMGAVERPTGAPNPFFDRPDDLD